MIVKFVVILQPVCSSMIGVDFTFMYFSFPPCNGLVNLQCLANIQIIGPSGVRALPLGVAAKRSVHYICDYFSFLSFSATYFSPRRVYATVSKFCTEFLVTKNKISGKKNWGNPPLPQGGLFFRCFTSCT